MRMIDIELAFRLVQSLNIAARERSWPQ